jgi:hypothetical protein
MIEFLATSYGLRACLVGRQAASQSLCNFQESLCGILCISSVVLDLTKRKTMKKISLIIIEAPPNA